MGDGERTFEVLVSFDGLDRNDRFTAADDDWSRQHVETGYLRDVTEEPPASAAIAGPYPPEATAEQVQDAKHEPEATPEPVQEAKSARPVRKG